MTILLNMKIFFAQYFKYEDDDGIMILMMITDNDGNDGDDYDNDES